MSSKNEKYRPIPRDYSFELITYFLEKGPVALLLTNLILTYLVWSSIYFTFGTRWFYFIAIFISVPLVFGFIFIGSLVYDASQTSKRRNIRCSAPDWSNEKETGVKFIDKSLISKYKNKKIAMETATELYFNKKIDFIDTKKVMVNRYELFTMTFTWGHIRWFFGTFLGQLTGHTLEHDAKEVGDVYNRGNDFYGFFLGKTMVYTSGIFHKSGYNEESLETAQYRKLDTILDSVQLEKGDNLLDIGCGWGTLVIQAAKRGANAWGCTLAQEQVDFAKNRISEEMKEDVLPRDIDKRINFIVDDYRKIQEKMGTEFKDFNVKQFDKITCVEMAEHVGIKNFQPFLKLVHGLLKDDGFFYIQMAGVRRTWSYEDLVWILFMGKYIFPGADASTPNSWVINQLERSGFEVHRIENCGVHYARTIEMWHDNWVSNKKKIVKAYTVWWYRLWDVFLSWSCMIARQGTSSVYMMTCHKNLLNDQHSINLKDQSQLKLNRTKLFIGDKPIAYQQ
eukprot:17146_1